MKYLLKSVAIFFVVVLLSSCNTLKQPKEVFVPIDYTEQDAINAEIQRINELKKDFPVMALWRSELLKDEQTIKENQENVFLLLQQAIEKKDFFSAVKYYVSLESVKYKNLDKINYTKNELYKNYLMDIPGLVVDKKLLPKTVADCINATVTIWVDKGIRIENGAGYADRVIGSGFFIDKRGYIVTNHHVISDLVDPKHESYTRLYIKLARDSETRIPAKVIGYDSLLDLALIKAEVEPPFILELGSSSDLQIGDKVSAIGTPLGLHGTITSGIVSAVDRKLFTTGNVLQIDAAVNSGNSGGPCIDANMKVQAIVFAGIMQYQGLNFAIPVEYLRQDLPFLYNGGKRNHSWIGAYGHTMKEGLKNTGLEIQYVMPGGTASRADIKKGDVITFVDNKRVYSLENMQDILRNYGSEVIISCNYQRDGESKETLLYLDERPKYPGYEIYKSDLISNSFIPIFGMELVSASGHSQRKFVISDILKGSVADESGFSVTDPVYVAGIDFTEKKDAIAIQINTRRKKRGYLDVSIMLTSSLDSPYYF